jgi:hypothetical protein
MVSSHSAWERRAQHTGGSLANADRHRQLGWVEAPRLVIAMISWIDPSTPRWWAAMIPHRNASLDALGRRAVQAKATTASRWRPKQLDQRSGSSRHERAPQNRLDLRSPRRLMDQPGLLQPGVRSPRRQVDPASNSPTRSPPHPCLDPAKARCSSQGRQRAVGAHEPGFYTLRLPAPTARHAGRRGQGLLGGGLRIGGPERHTLRSHRKRPQVLSS